MTAINLLAVDIGAESGRAILGSLDKDRLQLEEVYRFQNGPVRILDSLHWDVLRLWNEIKQGLGLAVQSAEDCLAGIGLDTWGVDFALLAANDELIGNPFHYRDRRTDGMLEWTFQRMPRAEIYAATGIQFMQINSLYQLLAMMRQQSPELEIAHSFLTTPDLFNFWLTGRKSNEFSSATTTQCYDPRASTWAYEMLEKLGLPTHIFGEILPPGSVLGTLREAVADEVACPQVPVIAPATHDTGSAVAAVPVNDGDYIYISSGTWSLMGVESHYPIITEESLAYGFTNEGGVNDTFRVLKNIMGLWLVQECRREWSRQGNEYTYDDLTRLAAAVPAFGPIIVPSAATFLHPGPMSTRIQAFCSQTNQPVPQSHGEIIRCALESLALEYRWVAERLDRLTGQRIDTIHIIGGGSRNRLLNQLTANATARTVIAGPVEATAIGNLLVQAIALGHLGSLAEARAVVRRSFEVNVYEAGDAAPWDEAYQRYCQLKSAGEVYPDLGA